VRAAAARSGADVLMAASLCALAAWLVLIVLPWQPHRMRERIEALDGPSDLSSITVLIPARNEATVIGATLDALNAQGPGLDVVVVDDHSSDGTADCVAERAARRGQPIAIRLVNGRPLPRGWGGKLWALQQGLEHCDRRYTLLLDADIELAPFTIPALRMELERRSVQVLSIMATLSSASSWEKLLVPPFVFFFKLLYPFALVQDPKSSVAAAAGGCVLLETAALKQARGFETIRAELIDDCRLAAVLKRNGHAIWLGVSRSVRSARSYARLGDFWSMVSRTAFTQLKYSVCFLIATTLVMLAVFWAPPAALLVGPTTAAVFGAAAMSFMMLAYWPTLRFYALPLPWLATLPLAAALYLAMTWTSAINYWSGTRARWKDREYDVESDR
jgi:hopene-associated glycosyltransferase HpnB